MPCCDQEPILPRGTRSFSRRDLLTLLTRGAGAAMIAPSLLHMLCQQALAQADGTKRRKKLLLLWLEGGPSQIDTFDPKPGAKTNGPFKALPTAVNGWLFSEHLPQLAQRAEHLSVIRTMTSKEGSHARARDLLHNGYTPNPSVAFPTLGAIVAHEIGDLDFDLPAFVQVDGPQGSSGYLGTECAPFLITDPSRKIENLAYPGGVDRTRMHEREEMLDVLEREFGGRGAQSAVSASGAQRRRARRLMDTKLLSAFDLRQETEAMRDTYGRSKFGQGVLLARRLLEHGVTAVEVSLGGWDTHNDNFNRTKKLCDDLDPAFAALIDDLRTRGLFDDTLVLCMGEFGRSPAITTGDGRNHWTSNYCVTLAGGGIKSGTVVGETDETGESTVRQPVQVADLFATIAQVLGLQRNREFKPKTRPVKLIDPDGVVVKELLA